MNWQNSMENLEGWEAIAVSGVVVLGAIVVGMVLYAILFHYLHRWAEKAQPGVRGILIRRCSAPVRILLPLLLINLTAPLQSFPPSAQLVLTQLFNLLLILGLAWLAIRGIQSFSDIVLLHYDISAADNLKARAIYTQVDVLVKISFVVVAIVAVAAMLMTFDAMRQLGVSLLASAGIVGIIAGFAAQRSLGTLFAGIQIAITQPIRLDDVVIVEGEWGRIEEITLTYVVVRIWDLRRLVLPITWFIENPFQNWTRTSAEILGTVFIYTDYNVPVEAIRQELHRLLQQAPQWDGKVWGVQMTNATERTVEIRALMSAADSGKAWDLRCFIRERLIDFIRREYPQSLPRFRGEMAMEEKSNAAKPVSRDDATTRRETEG